MLFDLCGGFAMTDVDLAQEDTTLLFKKIAILI